MKFLVVLAILFVAGANAADHCPPNRKTEVDVCAKQMYFLLDPTFSKLTKEDLPAHCAKVDEAIKCVTKYGKECLKGFSRQTLTVGLHGIKKHHRSICAKTAPLADEFIKSITWMNKEKIDDIYTCAAASIKNMKYIAEKVKSDDQIPESCCSYWLARQCALKKVKKYSTEEQYKFLEKMNDDAMTSMIEFLCSKQDSVKTCKGLMPDAVTRMEKVFKETKKADRNEHESYMIPFLDVISDDRPVS